LEEPIPLVTRAKGAILQTADGRRVVDAISSWWVTTHGHCHPRIVAAIAAQAQKLDQLIFAGWTHQPAEELARELVALVGDSLGGGALPYVFFSDSGSTAVEVALKMALGYWANRNAPRHRILVLEHSYHGDTIGAMSVGARGVFNQAYAPLLFDVGTIPFPAPGQEQATYDALAAACHTAPAAFIVEPLVLGAGGMRMYPAAVLAEMRRICAAQDVLFIADEVMTGWGRTGTLLACEQAGIAPDLLCLGKGLTGGSLPLAVTLASEAIYAAHYARDRAKMFYHSSSFTANPVACAAAVANLAVWREEPVRERIAALGEAQAQGAKMLAEVAGIDQLRRTGTILALDYRVADGAGYLSDLAPRLAAFFRTRDLLLRPLGNTVYAMPPYSITPADLATVHQAMAEAATLIAAPR
jgi:adenosylmethionine-8-amino-7-oxononanoate aminotransferase